MGNTPTKSKGGATDEWERAMVQKAENEHHYPTITIGVEQSCDKTITFLVVSDTHNQHRKLPLPKDGADVLLHCGDWSNWESSKKITEDFNAWLGSPDILARFPRRIVVGGNHELCCSKVSTEQVRTKIITNAEYYNGESITHESLKLWLSPLTRSRNLTYRANAFSKSSENLTKEFAKCPNDVDILVTHSPPYGILDMHKSGHRMGSLELWQTVQRVLPTVHVFGHCHDNGGAETRKMLKEGNWCCVKCTLENSSKHLACSACNTERKPTLVTFINASNKLNVQPFLLRVNMKDGAIHVSPEAKVLISGDSMRSEGQGGKKEEVEVEVEVEEEEVEEEEEGEESNKVDSDDQNLCL